MFKIGDNVIVIAGNDKGHTGKVLKVKNDKIIVEGCNVRTKHIKPNAFSEGGIEKVEAPIHISNVMHLDPKTKKPTRISYTVDKDGKKVRVAKKSKEIIK